jgi:hypothetical protein
METNENIGINTTTQISGRIGITGIMELDLGPFPNDHVNCGNYDPGTMCYDLVPLPLVTFMD